MPRPRSSLAAARQRKHAAAAGLPDDGHPLPVDDDALRRRRAIDRVLRTKGFIPSRLLAAAGLVGSTFRSLRTGKSNDLSIKAYERLADTTGIDINVWLGRRPAPTQATLIGSVGAGEVIAPFGDDSTFEAIDAPPGFPAGDVSCVVVRGTSMVPAYRDGDLLFYQPAGGVDLAACLGHDCVLQLVPPEEGFTLGRMLIKTLRRGTAPGLFDLHSYNPAIDPMDDQPVAWAAPVRWVKRA